MKVIIASFIVDIWTRIQILHGLKQPGFTSTLREDSNLLDDLFKKARIQNEENYRNAVDKLHTNWTLEKAICV